MKKLLNDNGVINSQAMATLANTAYGLYHRNWSKLWETLTFEYNPIENYNMVETMTDDETVIEYGKNVDQSGGERRTKTGTETVTPDLTDETTYGKGVTTSGSETHDKTGTETESPAEIITTQPNLTQTRADDIYAFNSSSAVHANNSTDTSTGTNTETHSGTNEIEYDTTDTITSSGSESQSGKDTFTHSGTSETEYDTVDALTRNEGTRESGSDTHTRNYELTRSGNIGVTTSQQMIEAERALWIWNYFDIIFADIDKLLTLQIY